MAKAKVLVAGAGGNLARALIQSAPTQYEIVPLGHAALDITDADAVRRALDEVKPAFVINGAAYNLVDKAESEAEAALRLNALGPAHLAHACAARSITLVHFSTDFVFDGEKRAPYVETDAARPISVYGASKLAGENIVLSASPRHYAIRVCRLFGTVLSDGATQKPAGNFPLLMLNLARERGSLRIVNDQIGVPSYNPDLARAAWQLLDSGSGGLFQLSNAGEVSFADYARAILKSRACIARSKASAAKNTARPHEGRFIQRCLTKRRRCTASSHFATGARHWKSFYYTQNELARCCEF